MKIVIAGSLGHVGRPLTQDLVKKGHSVTVISSKADRRREIEDLGAESAIGSLEDAHFLIRTLKDADSVFLMVPPNFGESDQVAYYERLGRNYIRAIEEAGVKRVVNLSSYGAHLDKDTGFILGAYYMEKLLGELSGVIITHLRAGYFYYNLLGFIDMIKHVGSFGANYGDDDLMALVHTRDIADVASEELDRGNASSGIRYVVSDERTASEVASVLGEAIGKPGLKWPTLSNEQMQAGLSQRGLPPFVVSNFVALGASLHSGALLAHYKANRPDSLGKIKLEEFAKEFANAFNGGKGDHIDRNP